MCAGREAGCCEHVEKGAMGRSWIVGRRMSSSLTSVTAALIRLLVLGESIQQAGQVCCVWALLGCGCEPRIESTQAALTSGGKPIVLLHVSAVGRPGCCCSETVV